MISCISFDNSKVWYRNIEIQRKVLIPFYVEKIKILYSSFNKCFFVEKKIDFCNFFCFYDHSYLPTSWAVFSLFGINCYLERIVSKYGRGAWETNDDIYIDFVQVCSVIGFITCSLVRLRYKCWLLQFHVLFLNVENTLHVHVMILLPSHV